MPRQDFRLYLDELRTMGADDARINDLREQYRQKNSFSGILQSLFQPDEGTRRTSILPYSVPEGMSLFEAQRAGETPLLPNAVPQGVLDTIAGGIKALENPGFALTGLLNADEMERAATETAATLLSGALARRGTGAFKRSPNTLGIFAGPKANLSDAQAEKALKAEIMMEDGIRENQIFDETQRFIGGDNILRFEIPDDTSKIKSTDIGDYQLTDVIQHPELFEAYPFLENMPVQISDDLNARGAYRPSEKSIRILANRPADEMKSTLLHEIQHAVQDHEGFLGQGSTTQPVFLGGSSISQLQARNYADELAKGPQYQQNYEKARQYSEKSKELEPLYTANYLDSLDRIIERAQAGGDKPRDLPRLSDWYKYSDRIRNQLGVMPNKKGPERSNWVANAARLMKQYHLDDLRPWQRRSVEDTFNQFPTAKDRKNALTRNERQRDKFRQNAGILEAVLKRIESARDVSYDPIEAYYRNAGEVEARNVQKRASGEYANQPPRLTQDYSYDEQIFDAFSGADNQELPIRSIYYDLGGR
jgi:hypothetical protein